MTSFVLFLFLKPFHRAGFFSPFLSLFFRFVCSHSSDICMICCLFFVVLQAEWIYDKNKPELFGVNRKVHNTLTHTENSGEHITVSVMLLFFFLLFVCLLEHWFSYNRCGFTYEAQKAVCEFKQFPK